MSVKADGDDHGVEVSRWSRLSSSPVGWREGDINSGVWRRRPRCEGVDLASEVRCRGGACHTSPDDEVLAPMGPDDARGGERQ